MHAALKDRLEVLRRSAPHLFPDKPLRRKFQERIDNVIAYGATPEQFGKLLRRNSDGGIGHTNEGQMLVAVISQAYADAYERYYQATRYERPFSWQTLEPCRFFFDGRMDAVANVVGLDAEFIRDCLRVCAPWAAKANCVSMIVEGVE